MISAIGLVLSLVCHSRPLFFPRVLHTRTLQPLHDNTTQWTHSLALLSFLGRFTGQKSVKNEKEKTA